MVACLELANTCLRSLTIDAARQSHSLGLDRSPTMGIAPRTAMSKALLNALRWRGVAHEPHRPRAPLRSSVEGDIKAAIEALLSASRWAPNYPR